MKVRRRPGKYIFGLSITDRAELVRVVDIKRQRKRRSSGFRKVKTSKPRILFAPIDKSIDKKKHTRRVVKEETEPTKDDRDIVVPEIVVPMSKTILPTHHHHHQRDCPTSPTNLRARPVSGRTIYPRKKKKSSKWNASTIPIDLETYDRNRKDHEKKIRRILKRRSRRPVNNLILPNDEQCKVELGKFRKSEYTPSKEVVRTIDLHFRTESRSRHHKARVKHLSLPSPRTLGRRR